MSSVIAPPARSSGSSGNRVGLALLVIGVAVAQFAVALVAARDPGNALQVVGALVLLACAVAFPRLVLVLALPATLIAIRVGPARFDLSVSDAVTVLGVVAALRFVPWRDRRLRLVLGALAAYLGFLAVTLVPNNELRSVLEWGHRGLLFGGSILIGVAIVHSGVVRPALRLFVLGCSVVAVLATLSTLRQGFAPADLAFINKNHAGLVLAAAFLVLWAAAPSLAWRREVVVGLRVVMIVGLAATQSRAAAIGLVVALAVRPLLQGNRGRRRQVSIALLVACAALITVTAVSINERDLSRPSNELKFNAINTRTDVLRSTWSEVIVENRLVGAGLRFWTDPAEPRPTPHNWVIGELGEAGVIGLAGVLVLLGATALALRRSPALLAELAMLAFVLRVTQGFADIFWVAGPLTAALILTGLGLTADPGTEDDDDERALIAPGTTGSIGLSPVARPGPPPP
ncbi:MAG: O-antigen ligase family protein [Acidimicrobiales bacterium]|nr:O-antigen ligase family protein [Acidimicrobiales bacterium]